MADKIIDRRLARKVLMAGNYYKHHHPGGISAVVQYWSEYIDGLQYYPTWKLGGVATRAWWFATSYLRIALRLATDREIKIVHLHFAADGSFWRKEKLLGLAKLFGKKVVMHCHSSRFKDFYQESSAAKRRQIVATLRKADVMIVLSESWKRWFASIGIDESRMTVLHNITDYPVPRPEKKVADGKVHFLFMGEIGERKGVFDILRGLAKHKGDFAGKIELRIGGNRNERQLLDTIQANGLGNIVKFEGWVSGDKKVDLLNWADVFILPSHNEGLPISILEAMSYGMPIISTPVGGIPEVVGEGNGVLVTPGSDGEIVRAMARYVGNPTLVAKEGAASRRVVETYLPGYVMEHLKDIYLKLL